MGSGKLENMNWLTTFLLGFWAGFYVVSQSVFWKLPLLSGLTSMDCPYISAGTVVNTSSGISC